MAREVKPSPLETAVLWEIARYRFVNVELLHRVVDASRGSIRDAARRLRVLGLIGSTAPKARKFDPETEDARREFGKPALFWVVAKGERHLAERRAHDPRVPFVLASDRRTRTKNEVEHRLGIAAIHIAFRQWTERRGFPGVSFLCDFEPGSHGREKVTAIPYVWEGQRVTFSPDGYARFRLAEGAAKELLVIEYERGGAGHALSEFFRDKLPGIRRAAALDVVERAKLPGQDNAAPFLIVFATAKMRTAALCDWPDQTAPVWGRFFVKAMDELEAPEADFSRGWWRIGGGRCDLYAAAPAVSAETG